MEFKDLEFNPHPIGNGVQALTTFLNGYGASIVKFAHSYGSKDGLYGLAIFKDGEITYDTPITDDVLRYLTESDVSKLLQQIEKLP